MSEMAKFRLLNCEFVNSGAFKNLSNKGKLLYYQMFTSGDDMGFVDSTNDIINALETNDKENNVDSGLQLLNNDYHSALQDLIDKGYLYEFSDNHSNKVHLIRHWFYHNRQVKGLWTNYGRFLAQVHIENNEYVLGKKPIIKENKIKQLKTKQNKITNNSNDIEINNSNDEWDKLFEEENKQVEEDDLPFEIGD